MSSTILGLNLQAILVKFMLSRVCSWPCLQFVICCHCGNSHSTEICKPLDWLRNCLIWSVIAMNHKDCHVKYQNGNGDVKPIRIYCQDTIFSKQSHRCSWFCSVLNLECRLYSENIVQAHCNDVFLVSVLTVSLAIYH